MEYSPETQKQYFQFAYQTGSDIWSHIPYRYKAEQMLPPIEKESLILDIGAGRGLWAMKLANLGFKVLGIDYIESIVSKVNERIKDEGLQERARFMVGNALEIPFVNEGFDMVTDVGTLQHITKDNWSLYNNEIVRVLKPHGYYLNISLSRRTNNFLGFNPRNSSDGDFTKFGVHYHFFSESEITEIFENDFMIIDQQFEEYDTHSDPHDDLVLVFTLMQKK
ncbi:MAG: class I SAM-dependent methyltransferase [Candidatus Pacebacteria bacterium]|nr:class I SAM-dependent methyltransferase [Candidatus Paceibacterota bacterium]